MIVKLNNGNNWTGPMLQEPGYDWFEAMQVVKRSDHMIMSEAWQTRSGLSTADIRALNPQVQTYGYWSLCTKNKRETLAIRSLPMDMALIDSEDWWLYDLNNNIVTQGDENGAMFIDVGKRGVKEAYVSLLLPRLVKARHDGAVFDYFWPTLISRFAPGGAQGYRDNSEWYFKAWKPFINHVLPRAQDAGYRVIGNEAGRCGETTFGKPFQREFCDGVIYEVWSVQSNGDWLTTTAMDARIEALRDDPKEVLVADFGIRGPGATSWGGPDPLYEQKARVSFVAFLIACMYGERSYHHYKNSRLFLHPDWPFAEQLGAPATAGLVATWLPPVQHEPGLWSRQFENGVAVLNYSDEAKPVPRGVLNGRYIDSDGQAWDAIGRRTLQVAPYTGVMLVRR